MSEVYYELVQGGKKKNLFKKIIQNDKETEEIEGTVGGKAKKGKIVTHQTKAKATAHVKKSETAWKKEGYEKKSSPKVEEDDKKSKATTKTTKQQQQKQKKQEKVEEEEEEEEEEIEQISKKSKTGKGKATTTSIAKQPEVKKTASKTKVVEKKASKTKIVEKKPSKQNVQKKEAEGGRKVVVDRMVPDANQWSIFEDYAVKLNQTNIDGGNNNNKFYIIQILQKKNGSFANWNRWGRIGEPGQKALIPNPNQETAIKCFEKKFKDKTNNPYNVRSKTPGKEWANFVKVKGKYQIVETEDAEGGEDDAAPMGKLTESQIEKGMAVLDEIKSTLNESKKQKGEVYATLSSEFYSLIPTQSGRQRPPPINNLVLVEEKEELLKFMLRMGFQDVSSTSSKTSPIDGVMDLPLPASLWAACQVGNICDKYSADHSNNMALNFFKQQSANPIKKMAQSLYGSILLYTSNAIYSDLNKCLREENHSKIKKYYHYLRLLFEAFAHLPKKQKQVWRGISVDLSKDYTVGKEITWWSVSSCTTNKGVAHGFASSCGSASLLTIDCQSAADISAISHYPSEAENLLPPGTVLKVISSKKVGNMAEIHLKEIGQKGTE